MDAVIDGEALVLAVALLLLKDARLLQDGCCGGCFVLDCCNYIFSGIEKRCDYEFIIATGNGAVKAGS